MRHSDPKLTANVYTDPALLDVAGALDALPELPLDSGTNTVQKQQVSGETKSRLVAPMVAPNSGFTCHLVSQSDKTEPGERNNFDENFANSNLGNVKAGNDIPHLSTDDKEVVYGGRWQTRTADLRRVKTVWQIGSYWSQSISIGIKGLVN